VVARYLRRGGREKNALDVGRMNADVDGCSRVDAEACCTALDVGKGCNVDEGKNGARLNCSMVLFQYVDMKSAADRARRIAEGDTSVLSHVGEGVNADDEKASFTNVASERLRA
jgi:hypothetical protein